MAYDETREIQDAAQASATEIMAEAIRLAITLANIVADEVIRARERRYELERQASEERARLDIERLRAERAAAEPLLRAVHQERFWRELDVSRDEHRRRLGRAWQAASEWASGDPYAAYTLDVMRGELRERFGIETPAWRMGGAELSRMTSLAAPDFRSQLAKARAHVAEADQVSYSVIIRDRDDPYAIEYQGESTVPSAVHADEAAALAYTAWATGDGAARVQDRGERFDVELRENTGAVSAESIPAVVLAGSLAPEVLAAAASRRRALIAGTEQGNDAELLYALGEDLDRLSAEETQRRIRREAYTAQLDIPGLSDDDRERLERNITAIDDGMPGLHQEQADTALRAAATSAKMRGEDPAHVYESVRLAETLDDGWWQTASPAEIAGVWDHVGGWKPGQAREEMRGALREGIEHNHRLLIPTDATGDMVAALFGGRDQPGPAVPLTAQGEALREQAQTLYEAAFDHYHEAATQWAAADQEPDPETAAALRHDSTQHTARAEHSTAEATRLMEQGTWLEMQTPAVLQALYQDNSAAAVEELAAQFEEQWGRPLVAQSGEQLAAAATTMQPAPAPAGSSASNSSPLTQSLGGAAEAVEAAVSAVEEATDPGRTEERRAVAASALEGVEDEEARESVRLAALAYPQGPEEAVAQAPKAGQSRGARGRTAGRQRGEEVEL